MRILIVEDNAKHITDAKKLAETYSSSFEFVFAEDYDQAAKRIDRFDGVMTDVFFPQTKGGKEEANGKLIAAMCMSAGLPFVMITSTYHHDKKTQPVHAWATENGFLMFDRGYVEVEELDYTKIAGPDRFKEKQRVQEEAAQKQELLEKPWREAFLTLVYLIKAKSRGEVSITIDGISDAVGSPPRYRRAFDKARSVACFDREDSAERQNQLLEEDEIVQEMRSDGLI